METITEAVATGRLGQKPRIVGNEEGRALIPAWLLLRLRDITLGHTNSCIPFGSTRPGFSELGLKLSFSTESDKVETIIWRPLFTTFQCAGRHFKMCFVR